MPLFGGNKPRTEEALAEIASKRAAELWESTLSFLERGKAEDAAGNYQAAAILISEGLASVEALANVDKREDVMASLAEVVEKNQRRLNELYVILADPANLPKAMPAPPPSKDAASTTPAAASSSKPSPSPAAATLQKGKLCLELAMSADEAGEHDKETIDLYTAAADMYFQALKLEEDPEAQTKHRATVAMMLERAEQLKSGKPAASAPAAAAPAGAGFAAARATAPKPAPKPPPAGQGLGDEEKAVLARSSKIAGKLYYPYMNDGQRERFHFDAPWEDPDGLLALSDKQKEHFRGWSRPSQFVQGDPKMIYLVSSLSITQTIITDCSFVSSLVIAAAYERRHGKQLITKIIYPQDRNGMPIYNPSGKYVVKLHLNGIDRKVAVDDRLPLARDGRLMTSHTTHAQELWVSIIEKAYMKVNGGYDFPGSNSGIDMYALTGWIPEQFNTHDKSGDFDPKRLWERMLSASKYGDCLLTVATGELAELKGREEEEVGLVRTHAYAVLQVREISGNRKLLQLKNPWAKLQWKGAYSANDPKWKDPALRKALNYEPANYTGAHDNGIFWIDYDSLLRFFQGVYLNWNPSLFAHTTSHHGQWPKRTPIAGIVRDDGANLGRNPQYACTVNVPQGAPAAVWILLSRHTVRQDQGKDDFLTVHVFKERGGFRCYYLEKCWQQGVYSNRPHCLVQFDLPPGNHKLTLALAQYKPVPHQVDYTMRVYSMAPFTLRSLPFHMRETKRLNASWKGITAGGCANYDTVVDNPRILLTVESGQPADLQLELSGPDKFSLGMELMPLQPDGGMGGGKPIASSGTYRQGFCLLEARGLVPGKYILTPATFEPRQEGDFSVLIGSNIAVSAGLLHPEGHGLTRLMSLSEWKSGSTAAGSGNHGNYHNNPQWRLVLPSRSDVLIRLRVPETKYSKSRPPLGLSLYSRSDPLGADDARGGAKSILSANDGVYSYPPGGALIPKTALDGGTYVIVASTFDPWVGPCELIVHAANGARLDRFS